MAGRKKGTGFNKKETPKLFLDLCKKGYSPLRIASHLGIKLDQLKRYPETITGFKHVWQLGKEACQAFHEARLDYMVTRRSEPDENGQTVPKTWASKEIDAQIYLLRVRFKDDWSEKVETKVNVQHSYDSQSLEEIKTKVGAAVVKPSARNLIKEVYGID